MTGTSPTVKAGQKKGAGPSPVVKARIRPELHARMRARLLAEDISESELLKRALERELSGDSVATRPTLAPADGPPSRLTVRMPEYVRDAAAQRAGEKGLRLSPWVCALVQSHVTALPVLVGREIDAVEASNRELAAIGRNINQIARALNEAFFQTERVRLELLRDLAEVIEQNRAAIRGLVKASRNAWRAE
jgi:predicted HicB family RNase H-like nuclease